MISANENAGLVTVKKWLMASSPSKRRRTSVGTTQVSASNKTFEQHDDEPDGFSGPPSYRSPTKASLARSHPHLLPRTEGVAAVRSKGKLLLEQRASALKSKQSSTVYSPSSKMHATFRPTADAEDQEPGASPPPEIGNDYLAEIAYSALQFSLLGRTEESRVDRPAQESEEGPPATAPSVSPSGATATERPTTSRDNIAETTSHSDNIKTALPSTPVKNIIHETDVAEPRLPSTPRQLGLEPPAHKPAGTSSLSPKSKGQSRRPSSIKSSPLKPKEPAAAQQIVETSDESSLGPCRSFSDYATKSSIERAQEFPLSEHHPDKPITDFPTIPMRASKDLAVSDPLFNLQAPLSLAVSASDEMEPIQGEANGLRSRLVMLNSADRILVVKIRMFLKHGSNKVASIVVLQLSAWTSPELGSWLRAPVRDRSQGAIAKAVSRYWDMAETRAFCWHSCAQEFEHLVTTPEEEEEEKNHPDAEPADIDASNREIDPIVQQQDHNNPNPLAQDNKATTTTPQKKASPDPESVSSTPPLFLLGRQSLSFKDPLVTLHISWLIRFTPSGEAQSLVSARASYPPSWSSSFGDLARTSELFARCIKLGKSVNEAVGALIGVMFP